MIATVSHAAVPPSLNRVGSRGGHWAYTRSKREWQELIAKLLWEAGVPRRLEHVHIDATLRFPVVRTRDAGNFSWMLEKAGGDALKQGGWIVDDTPDHYEFGSVTFDPELGPPRTTFHFHYRTTT